MELGAAGLLQQPFPSDGTSTANISYASQQDALRVLREAHATHNGLCLLQGPALSGKSTIITQYVETLPDDLAVAVVDGKHMNTTGLLEAILRQFGYVLEHGSVAELSAMLRVFSMQQTASQHPPLLIVENFHDLHPGALKALCDLATLKVRHFSALKLVLASDRCLQSILDTTPMEPIRRRVTHNFHLRPMTKSEAREFLQINVLVAGADKPDQLFPTKACDELWRLSGGWPGILERLALLALSKAETLPVSIENIEAPVIPDGTWVDDIPTLPEVQIEPASEPVIFVTLDGQVREKVTMDNTARLLIGRSEHNDVTLAGNFVSRHHAMLARSGNATFIVDLNSSNGLFVNSERVTKQFLVHDDVISIGNYRIKFIDPTATERDVMDSDQFAETAIMKTLDNMRNLLAPEQEESPAELSENLPTARL